MLKITNVNCPSDKIAVKCPYSMTPTRIVIHNTANDASAENEIAYMHRNNNETSFHFAVDDLGAVQGIELNRNAWHASDGNGKGNREGIAIEICYSKSGGEKWLKAVDNAAELTAQLLKQYGWETDKITKHQDYGNHKHCPHRILDEYGWDNFIKLVASKMDNSATENITPANVNVYYRVRTGGKWLPEVKNTEDYAGIKGKAITDIAVKVDKGTVKYRVHVKGGNWLPYVTGYDIKDYNYGFAGCGKAIDAVEIYYTTPDSIRPYKYAYYRVSAVGKDYYAVQRDNEKTGNMDGYAGLFGKIIDRLQIEIK